MKLVFKSVTASCASLPQRAADLLDKMPDGDLYDTRDVVNMLKYQGLRKRSRDFEDAGYCHKVPSREGRPRLWWGNKQTIAELKKTLSKQSK